MPDETVEQTNEQASEQTARIEWDAWLAEQPDTVKAAFEEKTAGLQSALKNERQANKDREKELRDLAAKAEKGSEAEQQLTKIADNLAVETQRADAYEQLHAAGVSNLKAAWTLARADNLFDRKGNIDLDALKTGYPEIFQTRRVASANGGEGTGGGNPPSPADMNRAIRQAIGR